MSGSLVLWKPGLWPQGGAQYGDCPQTLPEAQNMVAQLFLHYFIPVHWSDNHSYPTFPEGKKSSAVHASVSLCDAGGEGPS